MGFQLFTSLLLLIAFMLMARRFVRGRVTERGASISVVARAALSQRSGLALVSVDGRELLVGYGEGSPVLLLDTAASKRCPSRSADSSSGRSLESTIRRRRREGFEIPASVTRIPGSAGAHGAAELSSPEKAGG